MAKVHVRIMDYFLALICARTLGPRRIGRRPQSEAHRFLLAKLL
jgi:hypothetical protein